MTQLYGAIIGLSLVAIGVIVPQVIRKKRTSRVERQVKKIQEIGKAVGEAYKRGSTKPNKELEEAIRTKFSDCQWK